MGMTLLKMGRTMASGTPGKPATRRNGLSPALLLSGAVILLALPSAVLAFTSSFESMPGALVSRASIGPLIPATVDPRLARTISLSSLGRSQMFRFTPAGTATRPDRSVTVAVRVDPEAARAISARQGLVETAAASSPGSLRIAPTGYSLGVSRGFQSFTAAGEPRRGELPDLSAFRLRAGAADEPSRLNARIALDQREKTGQAPRTLEANGEQTVDVGGSFSLTRNIDVTAGVRYSQERDRLLPLSDGQKDSQAVYVGTQFRF
jgi:hypothetical protein